MPAVEICAVPARKAIAAAFALALLALAAPAIAQSDDFNDQAPGPQWSLIVDQPAALDLVETGGSLSILGQTSGVATNDALYLSNGLQGFRLSTSTDFAIQLDYNFSAVQASAGPGSQLALVFGVGRDLDGTDSAAVAYAIGDTGLGLAGGLGFGGPIMSRPAGTPTSAAPPPGRFSSPGTPISTA